MTIKHSCNVNVSNIGISAITILHKEIKIPQSGYNIIYSTSSINRRFSKTFTVPKSSPKLSHNLQHTHTENLQLNHITAARELCHVPPPQLSHRSYIPSKVLPHKKQDQKHTRKTTNAWRRHYQVPPEYFFRALFRSHECIIYTCGRRRALAGWINHMIIYTEPLRDGNVRRGRRWIDILFCKSLQMCVQ